MYGVPVVDLYALTEAGIVAVGTDGEFEILPHDLYVEVLDEHDQPCPPGVRGEVALTGGRNPFCPLLNPLLSPVELLETICEELHVDTGCVAAFTSGVDMDVESVGSVKSMLFAGEGVFFARLRGPGKVWIQSLPFSRLAARMMATMGPMGQNKGEGSVLGGIGDIVMGNN